VEQTSGPKRADPVALTAWVVLGLLGATALTLTAVDRTPSRAASARSTAQEPAPAATAFPALTDPPTPPGGTPTETAGTTIGPQSTVPVTCPPEGVAIRANNGDYAMGLRTMTIELVNCGQQPYAMKGYPVIQVLGADESPLSVEVISGPSDITILPAVDAPPADVTLQPGESADAVLVWRRSMLDSAGGGTYLHVAPHGGQPAQTVTVPHRMDVGNDGRLGVGPWTRP
jgi:hypothetical protein